MSFINDALAKAQAEKENRYLQFNGLLQTKPVIGKNRLRYPLIVTVAILAALIVAGSLLWIWRADEAGHTKKSAVPTAVWAPSPEATRIYMDALNHQRNGEYAIAEALYRQVIVLEPNHPYALNNLGVLQMLQKTPGKATELFQRAIALKGDYVHPYYNLACIYAQQNKIEDSLRHLQKALALKPDMQEWAEKDKDLKNLRENPEFKNMMEKKAR